jgi:hypothetical protein
METYQFFAHLSCNPPCRVSKTVLHFYLTSQALIMFPSIPGVSPSREHFFKYTLLSAEHFIGTARSARRIDLACFTVQIANRIIISPASIKCLEDPRLDQASFVQQFLGISLAE